MHKITIGLVGCGKAKADQPCPARKLYTSQLFRAALRHAEKRNDYVFILSAFHHLIQPDDTIQPYDRKLGTTEAEKELWAEVTTAKLQSAVCKLKRVFQQLQCDDVHITIYAGANYADPLRGKLLQKGYYNIFRPLNGLQIGERLAWFKEKDER